MDHPVVPLVGRAHVLAVLEVALLGRVDQVAVVVLDEQRLAVRAALSTRRPVPQRLGGDATARELWDVAGLAGHAVGVVVEARFLVRLEIVARLTGGAVVIDVLHVHALGVLGDRRITAARGLVSVEGVAVGTAHVLAVGRHVHVDMLRRLDQRGVQVAMLDRVAPATVEVAGAAVLPSRLAHRLRDPGQVGRLHDLAAALGHLARRVQGVPGVGGDLLVGGRGVVAGQAVDVLLLGEVIVLVRPAVAGVAARAPRLVGKDGPAEVVGGVQLAELLAGGRADRLPGPVHAFHDLVPGLVVARQASLGDLGAGLERPLQFLELAVIGGARGLAARGGNRRPACPARRIARCQREGTRGHDQRGAKPLAPAGCSRAHFSAPQRSHS